MQRKSRPLGKPFRTPGAAKKFAVYVKDPKTGRVKIVRFGDPGLSIKQRNPERRKNFRARHKCDERTDRTKPSYWSCRWGWPKNGKPRLQAMDTQVTIEQQPRGSYPRQSNLSSGPLMKKVQKAAPSFSRSRTMAAGTMAKKRFYVKTKDSSLIYNVGTIPTLITGKRFDSEFYLFTEPTSAAKVITKLMLPNVATVIQRGPTPGTHYVFGIQASAYASPGSVNKEDWEICTETVICWSEPDLMPIKIGSHMFGLSTNRFVGFPGQPVYSITDYSSSADSVTNLVALQAEPVQIPVAEFQTRSHSRHLLFSNPVTQQVIGPPGPHENLTELTVYLPAKQATAVSKRLKGRYEVHVTPGLGNQVTIRVTGPNGAPQSALFGLSTLDDASFEGLNVPRPNTCPLLLHRRIQNQGRSMRFVQGTVDELITSLVKIS
jgi:hypothetical protein